MKMNFKLIIFLCCALVSCETSKKIVYLQDAANKATISTGPNATGIVVKPKDILSIIVSSKNAESSLVYNLPVYSYLAGSTRESSSYSQRLLGYPVDSEGYIEFPVLGKMKVAGLNREELSEMIRQKLIKGDQLKEPIVMVEFMNFQVSVLGEVNVPGTFNVTDDRITLLEAIGRAGDMTIYGKRENVLVQREINGVVTFHRVDLCSTALFQSPVYYLQQNDIVYVEPNNIATARSRINENRNVGVWISVASFLTSLAVLIRTF